MSVLSAIGGRISEFFNGAQSPQANAEILFYRVELADEGKPRAEYNEKAHFLHQDLTKALTDSGKFHRAHLARTIDPYMAISATEPELALSEVDERIYELGEQARERHPWPEGTEYRVEDLLAGDSTPEAARANVANVVTYEVALKGKYHSGDERGSPAALENARQIIAAFATETDAVESIERFRPVEDGWYSFRYHEDEIRVRALPDAEPPNIEWQVGYMDESPRGVGWVDFVEAEPSGETLGELHLDKSSDASGTGYFDDSRHSILMPESIAESLREDARSNGR